MSAHHLKLQETQTVCEKDGYMSSVLLQKHGGKLRLVAYFSSKLGTVAAGLPNCLKAVAAASLATSKSYGFLCSYIDPPGVENGSSDSSKNDALP